MVRLTAAVLFTNFGCNIYKDYKNWRDIQQDLLTGYLTIWGVGRAVCGARPTVNGTRHTTHGTGHTAQGTRHTAHGERRTAKGYEGTTARRYDGAEVRQW